MSQLLLPLPSRRERAEVIPALTYLSEGRFHEEIWRESAAGSIDRESDMAIQWMLGIAAASLSLARVVKP